MVQTKIHIPSLVQKGVKVQGPITLRAQIIFPFDTIIVLFWAHVSFRLYVHEKSDDQWENDLNKSSGKLKRFGSSSSSSVFESLSQAWLEIKYGNNEFKLFSKSSNLSSSWFLLRNPKTKIYRLLLIRNTATEIPHASIFYGS